MILLIPYIILRFFFLAFNEINLNNPGNKFNPNGYIIDKVKLIKVSLNNINWVFLNIFEKNDL